jgi:DNA-directed RNA polymerase subunit RPC12/RpoP
MIKKSSRIHDKFGGGSLIDKKIQDNMLRPCRYCGSEKRMFYYTASNILMAVFFGTKVIVRCEDCGFKTKRYNSEYQAMVEWNGR